MKRYGRFVWQEHCGMGSILCVDWAQGVLKLVAEPYGGFWSRPPPPVVYVTCYFQGNFCDCIGPMLGAMGSWSYSQCCKHSVSRSNARQKSRGKRQSGKRHAVLAQVTHIDKDFMYLQPCRHWGLVYFAEVLYLWCLIHNFCTLRPLANPLMPVAVVARLKV